MEMENKSQPTTEEKGKMHAKEHSDAEANNTKQDDKYTRPPHISFGVELEFLMPVAPKDVESDDKIPGIAPITYEMCAYEVVIGLLRDHGIHAEGRHDHPTPGHPWIVKMDTSVTEDGGRTEPPMYFWESVEIASPPMYACDEAYKPVSAVVRLLTTKLRVRVNTSCGLHVHVGNGPHPLDMRAARNYAALLRASEPVLSTLQCPTRSFAYWSKSIRRQDGIRLTEGTTADMARIRVAESGFVARHLARVRYLGESPVASRALLRQRIRKVKERNHGDHIYLDPICESDDSDFEGHGSEPFERPRKARDVQSRVRTFPYEEGMGSEVNDARLDSESICRELPPQVSFPVHQLESFTPSSSSAPLLDEGRTKKKAVSLEEIAHLMVEAGGHKGYTSNWKGQLGHHLLRGPQGAAGSTKPTVEARLGDGSLDAEWIVIWIKIQCRLLEWARDADPSHLMRVIGKLSRDDHSQECTYDVLDFLRDLDMYTELKYCQERLRRGEEAWFECIMMTKEPWGSREFDAFVVVSHQDLSDEDIFFSLQEGNDEWRVDEPEAPQD
ncbi:putative amidoligase enzyme-domain-containing protein [Fusarium acuminatum]|uniref:Amidoligase enzyme-domain-containing protein n=1 Tax=Fusarium acuminatum TaxID=5515 RepID=A0ABZ2WGN7_9HYPO